MISETTVPGIGRKFVLEHSRGTDLVVIVHHDGKRELFSRDEQSHERLLVLDDETARQLGGILSGTYYQPTSFSDTGVPLGDAFIEWVEVPADSPVAGTALGESELWRETGATVIAVQRGEETHPSPDPEFAIEVGDVIVTLGTREEQGAVDALVRDV